MQGKQTFNGKGQDGVETIYNALKTYYRKADKLSIPFSNDHGTHVKPFYIKDSYRNLVLLNSHDVQENISADRYESSLAKEQASIYGKMSPLILDQLFIPIGGDQKPIKRILISGPAGIGKSTLCHHLAYQWSQGEMFNDSSGSQFDAVFWLKLKELPLLKDDQLQLEKWIILSSFDTETRIEHSVSEQAVREVLYGANKSRCLLILDGFDEVSSVFLHEGSPHQKLLIDALKFPQVIVTTRPYARASLRQLAFNREIEDVGFADDSIKQFIGQFFSLDNDSSQAELLWRYIQDQPALKRIAAIPLQTYFLCYSWTGSLSQLKGEKKIKLTELYQIFIREIWSRRLSVSDKKKLFSFESIEYHCQDVLSCFAKLAYQYFTRIENQLVIEPKVLKGFLNSFYPNITIELLMEVGFIHQDTHGDYLYVHLTIQEFFTAYHLYQQLIGKDELQKEAAINFILKNKYHSRYEIVMTFLIGIASRKDSPKAAMELLWDCLFVIDLDWVGVRHAQLIIRALEESGRLSDQTNVKNGNQILIDHLVDWIMASLNEDQPEFGKGLRSLFYQQLSVCPNVTQITFDTIINRNKKKDVNEFWSSLSPAQQRICLAEYWVPLLSHLPEEYLLFIITLLTQPKHEFEIETILQRVDWPMLRQSKIRQLLLTKLTEHITQQSASKIALTVWLSLLQVGDQTAGVFKCLERINLEESDSWLKYTIRIAKVLTEKNDEEKVSLLKDLAQKFSYTQPDQPQLLPLIKTISDWNEPRNEVIGLWWTLLKVEDGGIHQIAVQRLEQLLDKSSSKYEELQQVLWQQREWRSTVQIFFRQERFAILLKALRSESASTVRAAIDTIETVNMKQWNEDEIIKLYQALQTVSCRSPFEEDKKYATSYTVPISAEKYTNDLYQDPSWIPAPAHNVTRYEYDDERIINNRARTAMISIFSHHKELFFQLIFDKKVSIDTRQGAKMVRKIVEYLPMYAERIVPILLAILKNQSSYESKIIAAKAVVKVAPIYVFPVIQYLTTLEDDPWVAKEKINITTDIIPFIAGESRKIIPFLTEQMQNLLKKKELVRIDRWKAFMINEVLSVIGVSMVESVLDLMLKWLHADKKESGVSTVKAIAQLALERSDYALSFLIELLRDTDPDIRRAVAESLGKYGAKKADQIVPVLLSALNDRYRMVQLAVIKALGYVGHGYERAIFRPLKEIIVKGDADPRDAAIRTLEQLNCRDLEEIFPKLILMSKDKSARLESLQFLKNVIHTLSAEQTKELLPILFLAFENESTSTPGIVLELLKSLLSRYASEIIPFLLIMLQKKLYSIMLLDIVGELLENIGEQQEFLPLLILLAQDKLSPHLPQVISLLGKIFLLDVEKVLPVLLNIVNDEESRVRGNAAELLGKVGTEHAEKVISALCALMEEGDSTEYRSAIKALEQLGAKRLIKVIGWETHEEGQLRSNKVAFDCMSRGVQKMTLPELSKEVDNLSRRFACSELLLLTNISTCPKSTIQTLIEWGNTYKDNYDVERFLPLLCNYQVVLTLSLAPKQKIPLNELVLFITQLSIPLQRAKALMELRAYYDCNHEPLILQLADCLHQQLISPSEIVMLCQMLNIEVDVWLNQLSSWLDNHISPGDWHFPLVCIAQLLCYSGVSLSMCNKQWILCKNTGMLSIDLPFAKGAKLNKIFKKMLLEQISVFQSTLKIPHRYAKDLLHRNLPNLLPQSRAGFFVKTPQKNIGYQPVDTYLKAHVSGKSADCQDMCQKVFKYTKIVHQDNNYELSHDSTMQATQVKLMNKTRFFDVLRVLFKQSDSHLQALDLSNNHLDDGDVVLLCEHMNQHHQLRILNLSHNNITCDGLSNLLMTLRHNNSIKYLLLNDNLISFNLPYCARLIAWENKLGLLNLDLSHNYIPRGALIENKILADEPTLKSLFHDDVDICQRSIGASLIIHSNSSGLRRSFLRDQVHQELNQQYPTDQISIDNGCIGLLAYLDPTGTFGTHSFLVIERIHPDFGQRELIIADLVVNEMDQVKIRVSQTTPAAFKEHIGNPEGVGARIASADSDKINRLLECIYQSREIREFAEYRMMPRKQGKVNCHRQVVTWLVTSGIIPVTHQNEWVHIENQGSKCLLQ